MESDISNYNISTHKEIRIPFTNQSFNYFMLVIHIHLNKWDNYRQVSNIRRTLVGNYIVGHSDVVGESPVGAAPTTSSFST